jgi:predicted ATPase
MNNDFVKSQKIIKTPDQKIRVFVSSTIKDLSEERVAALNAIRKLHLAPIMFELNAKPQEAENVYRAYVEQSHIFIGIYGERYGWVAPDRSISGIEDEYNRAIDKPKLLYKKILEKRDPKLDEFLQKLRNEGRMTYRHFSTPIELAEFIEEDLMLLLSERFEMSRDSMSDDLLTKIKYRIPNPPSPLIGRVKDLNILSNWLNDDNIRLVSLTGPGGSGKTRLAIEIGRKLIQDFDGIFFIELASIHDPDLIDDEIASNLGLRDSGFKPPLEIIEEFLRDKKYLLILDNFEQIITAAPLISSLLTNCEKLKIIVTSRMSLHLRWEKEFHVQPLEIPDQNCSHDLECLLQYPSIRLFEQRAQAIKPRFLLTEDNVYNVSEIVKKVDGLPLAIELAAARIKALNSREILMKLRPKFDMLIGGSRDLPERQKTMLKTIEWSHDLLSPKEMILFRRLSVFVGSFTLKALEYVTNQELDLGGSVLLLLESLIDKNLVYVRETGPGEEQYFGMLETIHEYALERLSQSNEEEKLFKKHAEFFVQMAENAEPNLPRNKREYWLNKLEREIGNLRTVIKRTLQNQINNIYAIRLVGTLGWFLHLRGHITEGRGWASTILAFPEALKKTKERAKALFPAGGLAWSQGDYNTSITLLSESVEIFHKVNDKWWQAHAQIILSGSLAGVGRYDDALKLSKAANSLMQAVDDHWGIAYTLNWLGDIILIAKGDIKLASLQFEKSLNLFKTLDDTWGIGEALHHLGMVANLKGNLDTSLAHFKDSLSLMKQAGDRWAIARELLALGNLMVLLGDYNQATLLFNRSINIWYELGNKLGINSCLYGLARIATYQGKIERAVKMDHFISQPFKCIGLVFIPIDHNRYQDKISLPSSEIDKTNFKSGWNDPENIDLKDAISFVLDDKKASFFSD